MRLSNLIDNVSADKPLIKTVALWHLRSFILYIGTVASEDEIENEKKLTSSYDKFPLRLRVGPHFLKFFMYLI